jgi:DNA invertase Pin-like site-specific DNA recombinase
MAKSYVKYYRVSTKRQGNSGLGIDDQKQKLSEYPSIADFTEYASGGNNERTELSKAIEVCKANNAILLVAYLDRLARDYYFLRDLELSGIDFEIATLPNANKLTIRLMAILAEQERELIKGRQKNAWDQRKKRASETGKTINFDHLTNEGRQKGRQARKEKSLNNADNKKTVALARILRKQGLSYGKIAVELNNAGHKTIKGNRYYAASVQKLLTLFNN